jgi:hypothetical protein
MIYGNLFAIEIEAKVKTAIKIILILTKDDDDNGTELDIRNFIEGLIEDNISSIRLNEYGSTKRVPYNRKLDRYRLDYAIFVKDAIFCSIRISPTCTVNIVQFERTQEFSSLSFCFFEEFSVHLLPFFPRVTYLLILSCLFLFRKYCTTLKIIILRQAEASIAL